MNAVELQKFSKLLLRCRSSPIYFIENFCKVKHPKAGIIPFNLFSYQKTSLSSFQKYRFNIYKKVRQCGASSIAGVFALWYAMFYSQKTVLIVSKRDLDAIAFLDKNIKFVYNNLPQEFKDVYGDPPPVYNEHTIKFPNGSTIQSLTSDDDTLRSYSSSLNIIDEAAFMQHMDTMWCVSPDTIIYSDGFRPINAIKSGAQVASPNGINKCLIVHNRKSVPVKKITTTCGYTITAGLNHKLSSNGVMTEVRNLMVGDYLDLANNYVPEKSDLLFDKKDINNFIDISAYKNNQYIKAKCKCGREREVKVITLRKRFHGSIGHYICDSCRHVHKTLILSRLDCELAQYIGLVLGDGSVSHQRPKRVTITLGYDDIDVINWLQQYMSKLGIRLYKHQGHGNCFDLRINSANFVEELDNNKLITKTSARDVSIPDLIKMSGRAQICAFLRGLFSADGSISRKSRRYPVILSSASRVLITEVQQMLLGLGIMSSIGHRISGFGTQQHILTISGKVSLLRFAQQIGFIQQSKMKRCIENIIIAPNQNFRVRIKECKDDEIDVMDLTLSGDHLYISNGFISHNSGGWSTLSHGGSVIVISTPNGMGQWYHNTWEDATTHKNEFNPIEINWWDMNWAIEYIDELTGKKCKIQPRDRIRECTTKEEMEKWGRYYSPWLEEQYRQLQQKGEGHLFRQEILAEFIGSGNTVLPAVALYEIKDLVDNNFRTVDTVDYIHPVSGERLILDFEKQLWVWKLPVRPTPPTLENGRIIKPGLPGHSYGVGVDISSGEDNDFSSIQVIDYTEMEQVAELNMKVLPAILVMMVDYIGRWYNVAYVVPERQGLGAPVCQSIYNDVAYSNIYRMRTANGKSMSKVGYPTSPTYKPALVKCLLDHLSTEDRVRLYSSRLYSQLSIFVHLGNKKVGNVRGPGNHDDLAMALALALIGVLESAQSDQRNLLPTRSIQSNEEVIEPQMGSPGSLQAMMTSGGMNCLMPIVMGADINEIMSPQEELRKFQNQLGGMTIKPSNKAVVQRRNQIIRR